MVLLTKIVIWAGSILIQSFLFSLAWLVKERVVTPRRVTTIALIKKSLTQFKDTLPPTTRQILAELAQINTEIIAIDQ